MKKLIVLLVMMVTVITFATEDDLVARVIFAEASPLVASSEERWLVASTMKNRIGHYGFMQGKLKSMSAVVKQLATFSCIDDKKNKNMDMTEEVLRQFLAYRTALKLSEGLFHEYPNIVYYHDKSINMPKSWNNKYWTPKLSIETKNFKFYTITSK